MKQDVTKPFSGASNSAKFNHTLLKSPRHVEKQLQLHFYWKNLSVQTLSENEVIVKNTHESFQFSKFFNFVNPYTWRSASSENHTEFTWIFLPSIISRNLKISSFLYGYILQLLLCLTFNANNSRYLFFSISMLLRFFRLIFWETVQLFPVHLHLK